MKLKNKVASVGAMFMFGLTGAGLAAGSAGAAPGQPYFADECNSSASYNGIRTYSIADITKGNTLGTGDCRESSSSPKYVFVDDVRVDVDPEAFFPGRDVDSYVPGHISFGYDTCRTSSENPEANPINTWADTGFRYKNYSGSSC